MMPLFLSAFVLGLIFNAAPGAVFAESLRRGLTGGYSSALKVQIGSLVGDATWAILGLLGAGLLFQVAAVRVPLTILGALYLAYLGLQCFRPPRGFNESSVSENSVQAAQKGELTAGMTLSLTNPANVFYWAALGGVLGGLGVGEPSAQHYAVFFSGFMVSSVAWCFLCAAMIHVIHRAMSPATVKGLNWLCGAVLLYLAGQSFVDLWT